MKFGKHIQTRIFIRITGLILFLSASLGFAFSISTSWYTAYSARQDAERIFSMIEQISDEEADSDLTDQERSKNIIQSIKRNLRQNSYTGILLIYSSNSKVIFQYESDEYQNDNFILKECQSLLKEYPDSGFERSIHTPQGNWYLKVFHLNVSGRVRGEYFITASAYPDLSLLRTEGLTLFIIISFASIIVAAGITWLISKEIQINQKAKEQFFQNASHDLKTPLATITGFSQGIACGIIEDPKKAASIILTESMRMTDLVESMLSLSKMDCHELKIHIVEIELNEFLDECIESLQELKRNCQINVSSDHEPCYLDTDAQLLKRILYNVISNSIRYAETLVDIKIARTPNGISITITDDGKGFSKEDLPHIFERFYHGNTGSDGIGLAIVSTGIQYLGGTVTAGNQSYPKHGAVYQINLPEKYNELKK